MPQGAPTAAAHSFSHKKKYIMDSKTEGDALRLKHIWRLLTLKNQWMEQYSYISWWPTELTCKERSR